MAWLPLAKAAVAARYRLVHTPLILTGVWFAVSVTGTVRGWRRARPARTAFLVTEVGFYVVHNATGAFAADMPLSNPVLLIASLLGYASTATAVVYLVLMARARRTRPATPNRQSTGRNREIR